MTADSIRPVVILAGGRGVRIGGDKAHRMLAGVPLIDHMVALARRWSPHIAIAAGDAPGPWPANIAVIADRPGFKGPLAGLAAALDHAAALGARHGLVVACDTPFLPIDLAGRLVDAISDAGVAMPRRVGQLHPASALWHVKARTALPALAATDRHALLALAEAVGSVIVDWPDTGDDPFFNINTAGDLNAADAHGRSAAGEAQLQ
jgi:molybdopterin-guanine dinucleotide biosynthesis protein A